MKTREAKVFTTWTNAPDGLGGDIEILDTEKRICVHLGVCDSPRNAAKKIRKDKNKIMTRRAEADFEQPTIDFFEVKYTSKPHKL